MNRRALLCYQLLIGLSDASTGLLLVFAPSFTLRLMFLQAPSASLPYLSFIGAFVFAVGFACLYGGLLVTRHGTREKLEVVWLLTAVSRASVAAFVTSQLFSGTLEIGWISVAIADWAFALFQIIGLYKGWLNNVAP